MQVINEWQLKQLREQYPVGTRVELIHMDDPYNRKLVPGCQGTVRWVDDMGTIHVDWDCGSSLGLIPGEDKFKKIQITLSKKPHTRFSNPSVMLTLPPKYCKRLSCTNLGGRFYCYWQYNE